VHIDQTRREHSISKWKGSDALLRSAFPGRQERFREYYAAVLASGSLDLFQNRLGHGLVSASEDNIECHHARAELGRLPDEGGCVLIFQFECRQLLQGLPRDIDMNDAWVGRRSQASLVAPAEDLAEPSHLQWFDRTTRDQYPDRGQSADRQK
jgi:hypothetical protein